jgi:hypothetical protein
LRWISIKFAAIIGLPHVFNSPHHRRIETVGYARTPRYAGVDMLAYQTNLYLQLMRSVAVENTIQNCKESIINIQAVIQMRKNLENSSTNTSSRISFTQDSAE